MPGEKNRYASITRKNILDAAEKVYYDDPIQLQTVYRYLINLITH
jgi:hypothetical protein